MQDPLQVLYDGAGILEDQDKLTAQFNFAMEMFQLLLNEKFRNPFSIGNSKMLVFCSTIERKLSKYHIFLWTRNCRFHLATIENL